MESFSVAESSGISMIASASISASAGDVGAVEWEAQMKRLNACVSAETILREIQDPGAPFENVRLTESEMREVKDLVASRKRELGAAQLRRDHFRAEKKARADSASKAEEAKKAAREAVSAARTSASSLEEEMKSSATSLFAKLQAPGRHIEGILFGADNANSCKEKLEQQTVSMQKLAEAELEQDEAISALQAQVPTLEAHVADLKRTAEARLSNGSNVTDRAVAAGNSEAAHAQSMESWYEQILALISNFGGTQISDTGDWDRGVLVLELSQSGQKLRLKMNRNKKALIDAKLDPFVAPLTDVVQTCISRQEVLGASHASNGFGGLRLLIREARARTTAALLRSHESPK